MTIDHADRMNAALEARPAPTEAAWDRWRAVVMEQAPDLAEMLLGERAVTS